MKSKAFEKAVLVASMHFETDTKLSNYTSFHIGGHADYVVKPKSITDVNALVSAAVSEGIPYYFLGNGSNLLVSDQGYRGLIVLTAGLNAITLQENNRVYCEAGATVARLCGFACDHGLSGLEFAFGIPGSVGGGIYMNAGAYGGEFKDVLLSCTYLDEKGELCVLSGDALELSYRHSVFTDKRDFIVSGEFQLTPAIQNEVRLRMEDYLGRRKNKQPLEFPSCGSTFKRPETGFASALIDECGLKGYKIGGAQVSEKHAGFIINSGDATCEDVLELIAHVKRVVEEQKGITLECEVKLLS